jgi:hypothetical protein
MAWAALLVALASGVVLVSAGPGYRFGWWDLGAAFGLFSWAAWGGIAAAIAGVVALLARLKFPASGALWRSMLAVLLAIAVVGVPWYWQAKARSVPPIHDITTDTDDPPAFQAILPLREDAPNPAEYGGEEVARQQLEAYPDLDTQVFGASPDGVFDASLATAGDMGWEIVDADADSGRIEAVATTTWFGFKDDVVIRLTEAEDRTEVDVRSVSRVGRSDVGANAGRIRAFQERLANRLEGGA